jgi:ubiquitin thioesterase OTU1
LISTQAPGAPESPADVTTVAADDGAAAAAVAALAADAKAKRRFTDTSSFALRCLVCNAGLRGQQDAQDHAAATGHANFAQTGH